MCVACASGSAVDSAGRCAPIPGTALVHAFPENVSAPGEELLGEETTEEEHIVARSTAPVRRSGTDDPPG